MHATSRIYFLLFLYAKKKKYKIDKKFKNESHNFSFRCYFLLFFFNLFKHKYLKYFYRGRAAKFKEIKFAMEINYILSKPLI